MKLFDKIFKKNKIADKQLSAKIVISFIQYNTSCVMIDENGKTYTPPVPEPEDKEYTVKENDSINDFTVVDISEDYIHLKSQIMYMEGKDSTPKTDFLCAMGECIHLTMYGLYDAVDKKIIRYMDCM